MAHKALIKNELKQVLSIAVQRCHALSLEKGANYLTGRLAEEKRANARCAQVAIGSTGAGNELVREGPE